jgi:protein involved in polysaccharide export with SLBB domain
MNKKKSSQPFWKSGIAICAAVIAVLLAGCGSFDTYEAGNGGAITGDKPGMPRPTSNTLQPGELVKIDFSGPASPPAPHEENIKDDGTISLYLVGTVKAAGKTPGQLQNEIQQLYVPKFFRNLNVTVRPADRFFIVGGEVKMPNRQLYLGPITVTGAIKSSGDFTDFANKRRIRLTRADGTIHTIDAIKAQENPALDLPVYPGDSITVPPRGIF